MNDNMWPLGRQPRNFAEALDAFVKILVKHKVDFVVCGGVACLIHGVERTTQDLDLSVQMDDANLRRLIAAARELGLKPRIPEPIDALLDAQRRQHWVTSKHAVVYTLVAPHSDFQVDIFLSYPIPHDDLKRDAESFGQDADMILVSSKRHLIEAKKQVQPARRTDLRDIEDLEELLKRDQRA